MSIAHYQSIGQPHSLYNIQLSPSDYSTTNTTSPPDSMSHSPVQSALPGPPQHIPAQKAEHEHHSMPEAAQQQPRQSVLKTGPGRNPEFMLTLGRLLDESNPNPYISWTQDGLCVKITDMEGFSRTVLPVWFRHRNVRSFVRQLNMYGFSKAKAKPRKENGKEVAYFQHAIFRRGNEAACFDIRRNYRKKSSSKKNSTASATGAVGGRAMSTTSLRALGSASTRSSTASMHEVPAWGTPGAGHDMWTSASAANAGLSPALPFMNAMSQPRYHSRDELEMGITGAQTGYLNGMYGGNVPQQYTHPASAGTPSAADDYFSTAAAAGQYAMEGFGDVHKFMASSEAVTARRRSSGSSDYTTNLLESSYGGQQLQPMHRTSGAMPLQYANLAGHQAQQQEQQSPP
eukprot:Clim_evm21s214 gene=Clim_evmTU21s214